MAQKSRRDEILIKALVRAHRWRRKIESGRAKSITDLAEQEGVTDAYVCRYSGCRSRRTLGGTEIPVKRRLHTGKPHRITDDAVEAWRVGSRVELHRALGLKPWECSPFDVDEDGEVLDEPLIAVLSDWYLGEDVAARLRCELLVIARPAVSDDMASRGPPKTTPTSRRASGGALRRRLNCAARKAAGATGVDNQGCVAHAQVGRYGDGHPHSAS